MAIDRELVYKKLDFLQKHLRAVENMDFDGDEFVEEADIHDLVTFRLQQSVETCIDITTHLIANLDLPRKETAKDAFILLGQEKIIDSALSSKMGKAADFRNRVVHGYNNFDYSKFYKSYKDDVSDLKDFAKQILKFLGRTSH